MSSSSKSSSSKFDNRSNLNRRRFLSNFAFASTALATGVGSWVIRPEWANAAADPIKVGIVYDARKLLAVVR